MLFRHFRAEYTDDVIDLVPLHFNGMNRDSGFGHEQVWRITLHNERQEIGQISFRDGESRIIYYFGHIGYHIDPPFRGNHYAYRACKLLEREIRLSGKTSVVITCDPDNDPSRKTCEKLGCYFERCAEVPEDIHERFEISRMKSRYIWLIGSDRER
jgi:Predicted acetyltransferase